MDVTTRAAQSLARRSSRRQFFKFLGGSSLGVGLFLSGTDVSLGGMSKCSGCGGGPCNSCVSPHPICTNPSYLCKPCSSGAGCPVGCATTGEWFCCLTGPEPRCRQRCSECSCPPGCCHCFTRLPTPCRPTLHSGDQPCPCPPQLVPLAA